MMKVSTILLSIILLLSSCSRHSNIPRQHHHFSLNKVSKNSNSEPLRKKKYLESVPVIEKKSALADIHYETSSNDIKIKAALVNQIVLGNKPDRKFKDQINFQKKSRPRVVHHSHTKPGINSVVEKLKPSSLLTGMIHRDHLKVAPMDEDEDESEFSVVSAISAALGVIAWGSVIAFAYYGITAFEEILIPISFFACIGSIITGAIGLGTTRREKEKYSNRYMAALGLIMGALEVLAFIAVIYLSIFGGL